jgi:hypothetical protein
MKPSHNKLKVGVPYRESHRHISSYLLRVNAPGVFKTYYNHFEGGVRYHENDRNGSRYLP